MTQRKKAGFEASRVHVPKLHGFKNLDIYLDIWGFNIGQLKRQLFFAP